MKNTSTKKTEKGQSLVELAMSITVLLVLLAGVVDLGSLFFQYMAMRDAAQEGASFASVYPSACSNIEARVMANLHNDDPTEVHVEILVDGVNCADASASNACAPKDVKVSVHQPEYELMMPMIGAFVGSQTVDLKASITNTILSPICE